MVWYTGIGLVSQFSSISRGAIMPSATQQAPEHNGKVSAPRKVYVNARPLPYTISLPCTKYSLLLISSSPRALCHLSSQDSSPPATLDLVFPSLHCIPFTRPCTMLIHRTT
ncbi:uncharacterized protein G2W53_013458 [Senna tora]|uniref:Uncharacterized protein n=1 Tax=Senna tora TaxID=362788 RepID=A0A834WPG4_9FABA|nr:uncharacterized protein G2W53_013458 [Senna tora]